MNKTNLWRYALLSMFFTYLYCPVQGQITLKYDTTLIKKIANDVCGCYQNLEISDADLEQESLMLQQCTNAKILKYRKELNIFTDLSEEELENGEVQRKVSISLGTRLTPFLYRDCPDFIHLMKIRDEQLKEAYKEDEMIEEPAEYEVEEYEFSFSGIIKEIKQIDNLTFIVVENKEKENREFLWLNRFYGNELLIDELASTKKKTVYIEFNETEILNPKTRKMEIYKQINLITLAD